VAQLDNDGYRNLLIAEAHGKDPFPDRSEMRDLSKLPTVSFNDAIFDIKSLEPLMAQLGLNSKTVRLSLLSAEMPGIIEGNMNPLTADLGSQRILRTSCLTPVLRSPCG
jgi:hypothetical protein